MWFSTECMRAGLSLVWSFGRFRDMALGATMVTVGEARVARDADVSDRVMNHIFGCGLTLAAVMSRAHLDHEVAERLGDVIDELDAALAAIRRAAFDRNRVEPAGHS
jgi:hypothetical protein